MVLAGVALGATTVMIAACGEGHQHDSTAPSTSPVSDQAAPNSTIDPWQPRHQRSRPVIAVLAVNSSTELTDFTIPYGVLTAADVAEITTVSVEPGPVTMRPALQTQTQATVGEFDARYPDGADYVIVPALRPHDDSAAVSWIKQQSAKGATTVSTCNGAYTVAETGLLDGRNATSHWAGQQRRAEDYPNVKWHSNVRYVADGNVVSSAGVSASLPVSIALVEAIGGRERAEATARQMGIRDWGPEHDSEYFASLPRRAGNDDDPGDLIGVRLTAGIDEIALALTAEAYSQTGVSQAYGVAPTQAPIRSLRGLTFLPERTDSDPALVTILDPAAVNQPPASALDRALADIEKVYGTESVAAVARVMEYPGYT